MDLKFEITKQFIKRTDSEIVVQDSQNYVNAEFSFSTDWSNLTKRALFGVIKEDKYVAYAMDLDENDKCVVPWEALTSDELFVSVYGSDGDEELVTVNQEVVYLLESGFTTDLIPTHDPSPDIFTRIFGLLDLKFDEVRIENNTLLFYAQGELKETVDLETATTISWENVTGKPETFPASDSSLDVCLNGLAREINKLN